MANPTWCKTGYGTVGATRRRGPRRIQVPMLVARAVWQQPAQRNDRRPREATNAGTEPGL